MKKQIKKGRYTLLILLSMIAVSCSTSYPPAPVNPIPSADQVAWQELEFYGFLHFNMNTFTNIEWGYGDKAPDIFNPSELDARQWARVAKEAGMKGLIITAKHHDGFCLWPSAYTEHSVKNSVWKDGKGDVIKELAEACKEYGLKMGVYLSPWDRNHADYGKPEYVTYFRNQLRELLTNYGDIFEVWFDGANGGDGYYGGANEVRKVDKLNYYGWEETYKMVKELQPNAVIFSDAGPGTRWVGNEHGFAYETTWSPLLKDSVYGGMLEYSKRYSMGQENGTHWVPAEADVSIRPGWYYHTSEDDKVRSLKSLLDIYYYSIGRNSNLLLNFPVDTRGLIHENDVKQLQKLTGQLKEDFANPLAKNKSTQASNVRGSSSTYGPSLAVDGNKETYWATDDGLVNASLTIDLGEPTIFNRFLVQEYITLGQRVKKFKVEAEVDGNWKEIANQTTIGYKRILRLAPVKATKVRLTIEEAKDSPLISTIELYNAPVVVDEPFISRSKDGKVNLETPEEGVAVYYTLDGSEPTTRSKSFKTAFTVDTPTIVKTFSFDPQTKRKSDVISKTFDVSKAYWKVTDTKGKTYINQAIDDNNKTDWTTDKKMLDNYQIDLGETELIIGFTYTPTQRKYAVGIISNYSFYGSIDGKRWVQLAQGEFSNIEANPIAQKVQFKKPFKAKYIKLKSNKVTDTKEKIIIAEIGILTK